MPRFIKKHAFTIVGLSTRTKNSLEMNPQTATIPSLWMKFLQTPTKDLIQGKKDLGTVLGLYCDYEDQALQYYTLIAGYEVDPGYPLPPDCISYQVPAARYAVFSTQKGAFPQNLIELWQHIWTLSPQELGGERRFSADFEVYDGRALDPSQSEVDIYISLKE